MKLQDTTDPKTQQGSSALFNELNLAKKLQMLTRFRIHLIGLYYAEVGSEWDSDGQEQGDFLHHIELICSGRRQVVYAGSVTELSPGSAWFLPGCTPVQRRCNEECRLYYIKFRCEWMPGVDPLLDWPERKPICLGAWQEADFPKLSKDKLEPDTQSLFLLQAQVYTWLAKSLPNLEQIISEHIKTHGRFEPVFDFIEARLGADLRMEELAAVLKMPTQTFSMAFVRSVGLSPKAYLNRRLNQEAIKMLVCDDARVKEVAFRLKFTDEYYFSRFFKKMNGVPPALFRQNFFSFNPAQGGLNTLA
jgi:AraC-like DNA-binding protein